MEGEEENQDHTRDIPPEILGNIISLLSDGRCTRFLSSRWRHLWRSAPLNLDLRSVPTQQRPSVSEISRILEEHLGPVNRFCIDLDFVDGIATPDILDSWLQSPALDNLQELVLQKLNLHQMYFPHLNGQPPPPLPASVHRFSSTLRVAGFSNCNFPDGSMFQLPLLEYLSLARVIISYNSLHALLAACPALHTLLLVYTDGCSCLRIDSHTLRSIGVCPSTWNDLNLQRIIIENAPCLERLLFPGRGEMDISVISAPKLDILGRFSDAYPRISFGTTVFQGSRIVQLTMELCSVKVLALECANLSLDVVINFMKCFPCLEKLYIETTDPGRKNDWYLTGTLDIGLKEIVLRYYRGNESHINFAKFFVLNARFLESMRLELVTRNISSAWIETQHRLLQTEEKASRNARFDFVTASDLPGKDEQVHGLSTVEPFARYWAP